MDKQEMIDKNQSFIERMVAKCQKLIVFSIVPKFIGSMLTIKKIAKVLGYKSVIGFIRDCFNNETALEARYDALDDETRTYIEDLYDNIFIPQTDDLLDECHDAEKMLHETDIAENVINALTEITDEDDDESDDDEDESFNSLQQYLIDSLFDGIDPVKEFDDDDNE